MGTTTQTRVVKVKVDTSEAKGVEKLSKQFAKANTNIKKMDKNISGMRNSLGKMKSMFMGVMAVMGGREIIRSIDSFQLLKDRIRALSGEGVDAEVVFNNLHRAAKITKTSVENLAEGYNRVAIATADLGISSEDTIKIVTALQQTLRISGASAQESSSTFLQFSQALSLGRIQGQELRAVLLNDAKYSDMLAKSLGKTKGELKQLGEQGKLTTDKMLKPLIEGFDDLAEQAGKLKMTMGQAMTLVLDDVRVAFSKLNNELGVSEQVIKAGSWFSKNLKTIFELGKAIVVAKIFHKVALGIKAIGISMSFTAKTIGLSNPILFAMAAAITAVVYAMNKLNNTESDTKIFGDRLAKVNKELKQIATSMKSVKFIELSKKLYTPAYYRVRKFEQRLKILTKEKKQLDNWFKVFDGKSKPKKGSKIQAAEIKGKFAGINKEFRADMEAIQYAVGPQSQVIMGKYLEQLRQFKLSEINTKFEADKMSAYDYREQLKKVNEEYDKLIKKTQTVSGMEQVFDGITSGAKQAFDDIGTLAEQVAGVTKNAFGTLENHMFDFVTKGRFMWRDFFQSIMDDITKMMIRMAIIKPIAGAISGAASSSGGSGMSMWEAHGGSMAKGGVFNRGQVTPFAGGGVVGSDTYFPMSNGRTGLMGEAGPEAILPLSRGANGKLGVQGSGTVVNVVNNSSDSEIQTQESTNSSGQRQIDVLIVNKVNKAIGEGRLDRTFKETYGLTRRGR